MKKVNWKLENLTVTSIRLQRYSEEVDEYHFDCKHTKKVEDVKHYFRLHNLLENQLRNDGFTEEALRQFDYCESGGQGADYMRFMTGPEFAKSFVQVYGQLETGYFLS